MLVRVGCTHPPPFTLSAIAYKLVVYAPVEREDTLAMFLLYPYLYSVGMVILYPWLHLYKQASKQDVGGGEIKPIMTSKKRDFLYLSFSSV
jgi:hypothetical protein